MADGALSATWSGRGEDLHADFDLALQAPLRPPPSVLPVSGRARGALEDGRGLTLHLADSEFRTPHSTITAHGTLAQKIVLPRRGGTAGAHRRHRQLRRMAALLPSAGCRPLRNPFGTEVAGGIFRAAQRQLRGAVLARTRQSWASSGFRVLTWDRLTATITLGPGFVQISDGRVEHDKSSLELDSSAQLDHWQLTPASIVHLSAQAQHTPIEGLNAAINLNLPLRGLVSGRVDVEGTTANLAGSGSLRIDAGAFADEPFDSFSTQLRVTQSIWKLQNIQLTKNHGRMSGETHSGARAPFCLRATGGTGFSPGGHPPIADDRFPGTSQRAAGRQPEL